LKISQFFSSTKDAKWSNPIIIIPILITISLIIRLYHIQSEIPLSLDGVDYFMYAILIIQNGHLPYGILATNDGWPIVLSSILYFFDQNSMFALMNIQRYASIIISVLTIIPIYLFCKKFLNHTLALLGSTLFCFEPHLIQNSLLGITEPLFIFLEACCLNLFFSKRPYIVLSSFAAAGLFSLVRYEGLIILIPMSIIFFLRYRFSYTSMRNYLLAIGSFIVAVLPLSVLRIISRGSDGLTSHAIGTTKSGTLGVLFNSQQTSLDFSQGIIKVVVYLSWIAFPLFMILIPLGVFCMLKTKEPKIYELLILSVFLSGVGFYAYSRDFQEIRYLFTLFPIFCIVSSYSFYTINRKNQQKLFIISVIMIIMLSVLYLDWKKIDYDLEKERFDDAKFIIAHVQGMNYYDGGRYIKPAFLAQSWPKLLELDENKKTTYDIQKIALDDFDSIHKALHAGKDLGLTHLIIPDKNSSKFLADIFNNESQYPYLNKIYDSTLLGHKNPLKVFEIDYEKFEQLNTE